MAHSEMFSDYLQGSYSLSSLASGRKIAAVKHRFHSYLIGACWRMYNLLKKWQSSETGVNGAESNCGERRREWQLILADVLISAIVLV